MRKSINEIRNEWINDFALGLRDEFKLDHNESLQRAVSLMDRISSVRPADKYYWPAKSKDARDAAVRNEFNGRNLNEIKQKFKISGKTVYNIRSKAIMRANERDDES